MKDLLIYIAKNLVELPDEVLVTESQRDGELFFELHVAPSDVGRVIGRGGRIAKDIRTLVKNCADVGQRVRVEIIDTDKK